MLNNPIYRSLPEQFNLAKYLLDRNPKACSKTAFITEDYHYTYQEIKEYIERFIHFIQYDTKISTGCRLAIILPDSLEFIIVFLGCVGYGIIPVLINEFMGFASIRAALLDCDADGIVASNSLLQQLSPTLRCDTNTIISENLLISLASYSPYADYVLKKREDLAFIAYTSGSTGEPKGVMHAHYSPIVACELYAKKALQLNSDDIILSGPPLGFTYGLGTSLYMNLYLGSTTILCAKKDAFSLIDKINQYKPTVFFGVPSHYCAMLALRAIAPITSKSLRLCISAGERLSIALWHRWHEAYQIEICEGIGTTESTHIFISNVAGRCIPGSSGQVVAGYQITLRPFIGNAMPKDSGQLCVDGEGLMLGYWNKPEATQQTLLTDGLLSNDIYKKDNNGYYYFLGRKDDLVKVNGLWVSTEEIEELALTIESVHRAIVILIEPLHGVTTREIILFVESATDNPEILKKKIKSHLDAHLIKYKAPKRIFITEQFPLLATGKIDRKKLLSLHEILSTAVSH